MISDTRTVVRESVVRATIEVNEEAQKLTPPPPRRNPVCGSHKKLKIGRGDYVINRYTSAKVRHDPSKGFIAAHA